MNKLKYKDIISDYGPGGTFLKQESMLFYIKCLDIGVDSGDYSNRYTYQTGYIDNSMNEEIVVGWWRGSKKLDDSNNETINWKSALIDCISNYKSDFSEDYFDIVYLDNDDIPELIIGHEYMHGGYSGDKYLGIFDKQTGEYITSTISEYDCGWKDAYSDKNGYFYLHNVWQGSEVYTFYKYYGKIEMVKKITANPVGYFDGEYTSNDTSNEISKSEYDSILKELLGDYSFKEFRNMNKQDAIDYVNEM